MNFSPPKPDSVNGSLEFLGRAVVQNQSWANRLRDLSLGDLKN